MSNQATITPAELEPETGLVLFSIADIQPAPENDALYRPIDPADPEIIALAESIRDRGLLEPLVVSDDGYIISGHRRYAACGLAGVAEIRCRVMADVSHTGDPDKFLALLREHNRQRNKSFDEKLREEMVSVSPVDAYAGLTEYRGGRSRVSLEPMELQEYRGRSEISKARWPMLLAIHTVIMANHEYWPLSDRQIHYRLLNEPPLIHASKPNSTYANNPQSYIALCDLLTRARLTEEIPWESIADPTRPVSIWDVHADVQGFIRRELDGFCKNYWRDLLISQPNHIEILCEKNTVLSILQTVAMEFTAPITSGRGYCSLEPRRAMVRRFEKSGKNKLVLLILSDLDPDGEQIAASLARSLRDDFGIDESRIHAVKVALTTEHVERFNLPPNMKAKATSVNHAKFVKAHGEFAYELESLEPAALQGLLRAALDSVIDLGAYNREVDAEKQDAAALEALRKTMKKTMSNTLGADRISDAANGD